MTIVEMKDPCRTQRANPTEHRMDVFSCRCIAYNTLAMSLCRTWFHQRNDELRIELKAELCKKRDRLLEISDR